MDYSGLVHHSTKDEDHDYSDEEAKAYSKSHDLVIGSLFARHDWFIRYSHSGTSIPGGAPVNWRTYQIAHAKLDMSAKTLMSSASKK